MCHIFIHIYCKKETNCDTPIPSHSFSSQISLDILYPLYPLLLFFPLLLGFSPYHATERVINSWPLSYKVHTAVSGPHLGLLDTPALSLENVSSGGQVIFLILFTDAPLLFTTLCSTKIIDGLTEDSQIIEKSEKPFLYHPVLFWPSSLPHVYSMQTYL